MNKLDTIDYSFDDSDGANGSGIAPPPPASPWRDVAAAAALKRSMLIYIDMFRNDR